MTISIQKLDTNLGHKIPRPFNRVSSLSEMRELLEANGWSFERCGCRQQYYPEHLDTDHPVLWIRGSNLKFYAFTER